MPKFLPFAALRPVISKLQKGIALNQRDNGKNEALSSIINYEDLYDHFMDSLRNAENLDGSDYENLRKSFDDQIQSGGLRAYKKSYFLYKQTQKDGTTFRGFLGLSDVRDYQNGKILPHEKTLPHKVDKLKKFTQFVEAQAEPVLLMYSSMPDLEMLMNAKEAQKPGWEWTCSKDYQHSIWQIVDPAREAVIADLLSTTEAFYIADGHHRMEASYQVFQESKDDDDAMVLSCLISSQSIKIHDFNRVISFDIAEEDLLRALEKKFLIEKVDLLATEDIPHHKFEFLLLIGDNSFTLRTKNTFRNFGSKNDILLDHTVAEQYILNEIFGIKYPEKDPIVYFIPGNSSSESIAAIKAKMNKVEHGIGIAISPIHFHEIKHFADQLKIMPAKCTFIEPKLPPGILIFDKKLI